MSHSTTVDKLGRIVLPSEVRRRLNLTAGARLRLEVVAERIELTPEPDVAPQVRRSNGRLVLQPSGIPRDAAAEVRAERENRSDRRR